MSTIGANAQWMPTARASRAATACPRSIVAGSHDAASAIGTGRIVRSPWIDVEAEERGDAEPVALDREPLQPVDLRRVGHEQQRRPPRQRRLDQRGLDRRRLLALPLEAEVEVLAELPGLLGRRQLGEQRVGPGPDLVLVGHLAAPPLDCGECSQTSARRGTRPAPGVTIMAS